MVPRFFFDIHNSYAAIDAEGVELTSVEAARAEALRLAAGVLAESEALVGPVINWRIDVRDESGRTLFRHRFGRPRPDGGDGFAPAAPIPSNFWEFAATRRLKADGWGDYVRLVKKGSIVPPLIESSDDLRRLITQTPGFDFRWAEVRSVWRAYQNLRGL